MASSAGTAVAQAPRLRDERLEVEGMLRPMADRIEADPAEAKRQPDSAWWLPRCEPTDRSATRRSPA